MLKTSIYTQTGPRCYIFKMPGRHRTTTPSNEKAILLVPFESASNALQNGTKIIQIRYILILKTIPKVLVSHSMAASFDGVRAYWVSGLVFPVLIFPYLFTYYSVQDVRIEILSHSMASSFNSVRASWSLSILMIYIWSFYPFQSLKTRSDFIKNQKHSSAKINWIWK